MPPIPKNRPRQKTYLRAWRKFRKLSQEKASGLIGNDRSTLSKIEAGKVPYDQILLEAAADAYGCTPADLLMRDPASIPSVIFDEISKLPKEHQTHVMEIVGTFKKTG